MVGNDFGLFDGMSRVGFRLYNDARFGSLEGLDGGV